MNLAGGLIGGGIGALIGAAIWAGVGYATGYEVGWIAWGIGALCGSGVAIGTQRQGGALGGVLAVLLSLAGIALGKWGSVELAYRSYFNIDEMAIAAIADDVDAEHEEAGMPVRKPVMKRDADHLADEYAPDVWREAQRRWAALSSEQQADGRRYPPSLQADFIVGYIADNIVEEREDKGQKVNWPAGHDFDTAWRKAHYPEDIWKDADQRWNGMTPDEQVAYRKQVVDARAKEFELAMSAVHSVVSSKGFMASIGLFDILFVLLAVGTAFRIGSGGGE